MSIEKQVSVQFKFNGSEELAALLKQESRKAKAESIEGYIAGLLEASMKSVTLEPRKRTRKPRSAAGARRTELKVRKKQEQAAV